MTGPSNQFWTETILREGFWATRPFPREQLSLLGSATVTVWCTSQYKGFTPPASRLRSTINTGIASYLSGHLGVTSSCCKTRLNDRKTLQSLDQPKQPALTKRKASRTIHTTCINRLQHSLESRGNDHASWQPQRQKSEICFLAHDYESYDLIATFARSPRSV